MRKEIIINATANEIRIAITEDGRLAELFVETPEKERSVGDIYLGKIAKVMPGIRAAFIDLGLKQDAFLHFSDIGNSFTEYSSLIGDEDSDIDIDEDNEGEDITGDRENQTSEIKTHQPNKTTQSVSQVKRQGLKEDGRGRSIPDLKRGQDILVQVTKEPIGKKGVRVTSEVSLPGRFLVLLPYDGKIGVSKKLQNFKEKRRLRRIVRSMLPETFGVIIRTVAQEQDEAALKQDIENLLTTWRDIEKSIKSEEAPALVYKDMATTSSVIRDLFSESVDRIIIDSKKLYKEIRLYVKSVSPELVDKIELYKEREPIFDTFEVEKEIVAALSRKVWLKSGGYIIIEQTEAMFVVDVNSGRYAAKRDQELNSLRTNLEASREICRQLRLRDIGGIIVIDFIDLEDEKNRKKVYDELRKEFRRDRSKVTVLPMTEIGIVQITRQRIRQNILSSFSEPCPVCGGGGLVESKSSIGNHIERWIRRFKSESHEFRLKLYVHSSIAHYLREGTLSRLTKLMFRYRLIINIEEEEKLSPAEFHCFSYKQNKDITELYNS